MQTRRDVLASVAAASVAATGFVATSGLAVARQSRLRRSKLKEAELPNPDLAKFYNRYIDAINGRHFETVSEMVHEDVLQNGVPHKRADVLTSLRGIADACPDYHWGLKQLVIEGDLIAARLQNRGTPTKTFFDYPATGRRLNFMEFCQYRVRDGRFVEMWFLEDRVTIGRQLRGEGA